MEESTFVLRNAIQNGLEEGSWQEFEYISAYLTNTIPWSVVPYEEKNKMNIPIMDTGIDSISKDYKVAVQAKSGKKVELTPIDHFAFRARHYYTDDIIKIVSTRENIKLSRNTNAIKNFQHKIITKKEIQEVRNRFKNEKELEYKGENKRIIAVRDKHQNKIVSHYLKSNKKLYTIKAPCGYGKTHVIKKIIDKFNNEKQYVIFVPSIPLAYQYKSNFNDIEIVCSEKINPDLTKKILVCVYNSIEKIKHLTFEIVFIDEAHHIKTPELYIDNVSNIDTLENNCKDKDKTYLDELKEFTIQNKSILLSATIDEPDFEVTEKEAIEKGFILDYQIISMVFEGEPTMLKIANNIKANILTYNSIIAYSNTITRAKYFHEDCKKIGLKSCLITAETPTKERMLYFSQFMSGKINIISSVNTIAEGIDLPRCNTALFIDKRGSKINLKQCTGRVSRKFQGKTQGYVIIATSQDDEYKNVINFISTLEDNRNFKQDDNKFICVNGDNNMQLFDVYNEFTEHLYNKLWDKNINKWNVMYELYQEFYTENNRIPKSKEKYKEINIGMWQDNQRKYYNKNNLSKEKEEKLNNLNYWLWNVNSKPISTWNESFELLQKYIKENNGKYPEKEQRINGNDLDTWMRNQRLIYNDKSKGKEVKKIKNITKDQVELLKSLPNWEWTKVSSWEDSYNNLQEYIKTNGKLPTRTTNSIITAWIDIQRRNYKKEKLTEEQINQLEELNHWVWDAKPPKFDIGYELVKAFMVKNDRPIKKDDDKTLYNWVQNTKKLEKNNKLNEEEKDKIKELPHWNYFSSANNKIIRTNKNDWNEMYELMRKYINENNKLPKSNEIYEDKKLGPWMQTQKRNHKEEGRTKDKKLLAIRENQLLELDGWKWC